MPENPMRDVGFLSPRDEITPSRPLRSINFNSLSEGPLGFLSPVSTHFCTVDTLVL